MIATSKDGLDFRTEADTGIVGTEPAFARLSDGSLLLYHGEQSAATGSLIYVARGLANPVLAVVIHGEGYVRSTPDGISCPSTCTETLNDGSAITLHALPAEGHMLASWSGACSGHRACSLRMNGDRIVTARFVSIPKCKKGQRPTARRRCRR